MRYLVWDGTKEFEIESDEPLAPLSILAVDENMKSESAKGGPGSGHFGHGGREGKIGGSTPGKGGLPDKGIRIGKTLVTGSGVDSDSVEYILKEFEQLPSWLREGVDELVLDVGSGKGFRAGGQDFETGATWDRSHHRITLHDANQFKSGNSPAEYIAHEIGHNLHDRWWRGVKDNRRLESAFENWLSARKKGEDGITDYSKAWNNSSETIAEMTSILLTGGYKKLQAECERHNAMGLYDAYKEAVLEFSK